MANSINASLEYKFYKGGSLWVLFTTHISNVYSVAGI